MDGYGDNEGAQMELCLMVFLLLQKDDRRFF